MIDRFFPSRLFLSLCSLLLGLALLLGAPVRAASPAPAADRGGVVVLTVKGPINPVVAGYVTRGLGAAGERGAVAALIELDTPGGLDSAMRDIIQAMIASRVPVVVYVAPQGARAASAGMFITVAAHVAAMAPDTAIGAAHPVGGGGEEIKGPMADKVTNDAVAYGRGLAERRGRNANWVEQAIRKSVSASANDALKQGVIDMVAPSRAVLLERLDGRRVNVDGQAIVLRTKAAATVPLPMSGVERFLYAVSNPGIALILMNLGILGIVFELQNPGAFLPGIVGVILLLLGLFSLGMLPVNGVGVALIVFGLLLFAAELFAPTFGLLALGGVVSLVLGSLLLFPSDVPGVTPPLALLLTISLSTGALVLLGTYYALRAQRRRVSVGREELAGQRGEVRQALAPHGLVFLEGELWSAIATDGQPIPEGAAVEVERVEGLKLFVKKISSEPGK